MFKLQTIRQAARAATRHRPAVVVNQPTSSPTPKYNWRSQHRNFCTSPVVRDKHEDASTSSEAGASGKQEGQFARTDKSIQFENPNDDELPGGTPSVGRGGVHSLRTLASFSLEGRVAVVTGGARGLGLVMVQALLNSGANVAIVDLNKEEADKQVDSLQQAFKDDSADGQGLPKITTHKCDVSSPASVQSTFEDIVAQQGKVDNLVTSAGFTENFDAVSYPHERMQKLWGVNVDGTYLFAVETAKHLMGRKAPGSIVCIASMSGHIVNVPQPQAPYNASKAAVRHLASSLAVEWADAGIRVNSISPGYMLTALTEKILEENPALKQRWTSLIPVGKMGRPEDLMGAVVFLCSDASGYVTGTDLLVDGGYTRT